jgi:FkbM family methyltransferase
MKIIDLFRWSRRPDGCFPIRHEGKTYLVPERGAKDHLLDQMRKRRSFYEVDLLEAVRARAKAGRVAIDVGANVGNHSLFFSAVMGLRVVAFEPVQVNRDLLCKLAELNKDHVRIDVVPTALSDRAGEVRLSAPDAGNPGTFRIAGGAAGFTAVTERLDDALRRLAVDPLEVGVLKVDVEGHELQVLEGAPELLARADPVVAVEVFTTALFDAVLAKLEPAGYRAVSVHCATPTVLFCRGVVDAKAEVRERIALYEAGGRA